MNTLQKVEQLKKCIDKERPFEGHMLTQLRAYYRIGLTYSSNALEGNTHTITETKVLLEDGLTVGGKPLRETYEVLGHAEAYDFMFSLYQNKEISIEDIKTLHRLFYQSIDENNAGVWRQVPIIVTGTDYAFPSPEAVDAQMLGLEAWIKSERDSYHPVDFAALLHLKFVSIHPFIDGNGRVSRLLMNLALIQSGYLLAIVPPICRMEYLNAIRTYQLRGNPNPFREHITERVLESEREVMRLFHIPMPKRETDLDR